MARNLSSNRGNTEVGRGTVSLLLKIPSAHAVTEHRPVTKLCTKLILLDNITNKRLMNTIEDRQLIDDVQEGFRRHRSAKRQTTLQDSWHLHKLTSKKGEPLSEAVT